MMEFLVGFGAASIGAVIVVLLVKLFKREEEEEYTEEFFDARAEAAKLTTAELDEIIRDYSGENVPFDINEDVGGEVNEFHVTFIEAYGKRYSSIHETVMRCLDLEKEEKESLQVMEASFERVRTERMAPRRYLEVRELLDEDIYIYEPCKMSLDVASRKGMTSRMGVVLVRGEDLKMGIDYIYVSKTDITKMNDRYEFDMQDDEDRESFKLLVREKGYFKEELKELDVIVERLNRFNELVDHKRVEITEDGQVVIFPPTPQELKAKRAKLRENLAGGTIQPEPTPSTARADVDNEFVSSASL